jgi:hypothetical protein
VNAPFSPTVQIAVRPVAAHIAHDSAPTGTFGMALRNLDHLPGLSQKVRENLRGAIRKCANSISPLGLEAAVDIPAVEEWIDRISAAQLGFAHHGSLSAFTCYLWRALKLTGHPVSPFRYAPANLSEPWAALQAKLKDLRVRKKLSRFMHLASERAWSPSEVTEPHLHEFRLVLAQTCLKSKADKTFRNTVRAWNLAVETIDGWPSRCLDGGVRRDWTYILPWSKFPSSYRDDVEAFITHFDFDSLGSIPGGGLRPRTKVEYREELRRAASILVRKGMNADSIASLREVVKPDNVVCILKFLGDRNGEKRGGHAAHMALLLFVTARDHVGAQAAELNMLREFVKLTADTRRGKMADRTHERLLPFDDPLVLDQLKNLPHRLVNGVIDRPVDISNAKAVRLALALALLFQTALPPGKVVALDLDLNFVAGENPGVVYLTIPPDEFDKRPGFKRQLKSSTVEIWRLYVEKYRVIHLGKPCRWLFPRADESHWPKTGLYVDLRDICNRHLHLVMTPQIIRPLLAKVIYDRVPEGHVIVQQALGYKQLLTVQTYFKKLRRARTRPSIMACLKTIAIAFYYERSSVTAV